MLVDKHADATALLLVIHSLILLMNVFSPPCNTFVKTKSDALIRLHVALYRIYTNSVPILSKYLASKRRSVMTDFLPSPSRGGCSSSASLCWSSEAPGQPPLLVGP